MTIEHPARLVAAAPADAPAHDAGLDLPYIVYGTLRPGGLNSHLVTTHGGRWGASLALPGYVMLDSPHGYPYLVPLDPARASAVPVRADLVEPPADATAQAALRAALDELETYRGPGGDNEYERVAVRIDDAGVERCAWIYVVSAAVPTEGLPLIGHGDWMEWSRA
ncbi:gamma-glutamylcyclotransferase [Demequina sp. NBRC 110057]|uniref:gamma-glutamylcyclotransferase family protein n=1 Tax=Demequina sp. NBRC 110057 TaxID=1570346 RepID=UPI00190E9ACD|nr:gamma-glutamylcyclotransferase [Demequina sp. NBRC 110057]